MRFEPSNPVIDVGHRTWITRVGRHAKIQRSNDDAALRERFVDRLIHGAVVVAPRAAVQFDHAWERTFATRLEDTSQQRLVSMAEVFNIRYIKLIRSVRCHDSHLPKAGRLISKVSCAFQNRPSRTPAGAQLRHEPYIREPYCCS